MEQSFLKATLLPEFLDTLRRFGELHGPTVTEAGVTVFAPLTDASDLRLEYQRTQIPPKKYLFPFREATLRVQDGSYRLPETTAPEIMLFGVHGCDLEGIAYLDQVFLAENPDPTYAARRAHLTLIGISCEPDGFCFCSGMFQAAPCDLFLVRREEGFDLVVSSARGEAIAEAANSLLIEMPERKIPPAAPCPIPPQDPQLRFSDNPLWEKFARRCVSCGACSVCCPTCYCFDLREYPALTGGGTRLREWDNCLFVTHGEVAGGANFRATHLERLRYRFLHKYCGFSPLQGICSCVGCGRCKEVCPVDIDLREVIDTGSALAGREP